MITQRKRDYQKKIFKNPFFSNKNKSKKIGATKKIVVLVILVGAGAYFFFSLEIFIIKNIEVVGNDKISQSEIRQLVSEQMGERRFLVFKQRNIFFFNSGQAESKVGENYFFNNIKIKKRYPNSLRVEVEENTFGVIWSSNNVEYHMNLDGLVTRVINSQELVIQQGSDGTDVVRSGLSSGLMPVIKDLSGNEVTVGQIASSDNLVNFVAKIYALARAGADYDVSHFNVERPYSQEVSMVTKEGWQAYFNVTNPVESQFVSLNSVLSERVKDRKSLEYIDLRFGERIFYK